MVKLYDQDSYEFKLTTNLKGETVTKKRKYGTNSWRLVCKHKDCKHIAKLNGLCITHGGGYYCQYKNCTNIVNSKYKNCEKHHFNKVKCRISKCNNLKKYCNGLCELNHTGFPRKSKKSNINKKNNKKKLILKTDNQEDDNKKQNKNDNEEREPITLETLRQNIIDYLKKSNNNFRFELKKDNNLLNNISIDINLSFNEI